MESAVAEGLLVPIPVGKPYANVGFHEEWYRLPSGHVWRLVDPDFPFKGVFEKVPELFST
jgi:hypothetical protein